MIYTRLLLGAVLCLPMGPAFADGNKLLSQCQSAEHFMDTHQVRDANAIGFCLGLVQGVRNTMTILDTGLNPSMHTCWPPDGIDNGQAVRIVVQYLKRSPERLHEDEVFLSMLAFRAAFPCKKAQ